MKERIGLLAVRRLSAVLLVASCLFLLLKEVAGSTSSTARPGNSTASRIIESSHSSTSTLTVSSGQQENFERLVAFLFEMDSNESDVLVVELVGMQNAAHSNDYPTYTAQLSTVEHLFETLTEDKKEALISFVKGLIGDDDPDQEEALKFWGTSCTANCLISTCSANCGDDAGRASCICFGFFLGIFSKCGCTDS